MKKSYIPAISLIIFCTFFYNCNQDNNNKFEELDKKISQAIEENKNLKLDNIKLAEDNEKLKRELINNKTKELEQVSNKNKKPNIANNIQNKSSNYSSKHFIFIFYGNEFVGYSSDTGNKYEDAVCYSKPIKIQNPSEDNIYKEMDNFEQSLKSDPDAHRLNVTKREYKSFSSYSKASKYADSFRE